MRYRTALRTRLLRSARFRCGWSKETIVSLYAAAVAVAFGLIVVFAVAGWIVRPAIIAVAAAPLALPVYACAAQVVL